MALGKLVLIIGPSGVGKSVILQQLRTRHPEFVFPRSATTRARRPGEGDDLYHFVDDETFNHWLKTDKFLETATVHLSARYGTLLSEIVPAIEQGKTVVREVDVQGLDAFLHHWLFAGPASKYRLQTIFILPESKESLMERIRKRAPMTEDELRRRMESMERELKYASATDVQVKNSDGRLEEAIAQVEKAIAS